MHRRRFLRGLTATGAALALPLPRMARALNGNGDRFADGGALPARFGVWFFGNGINPATWHPAGPGGDGSAWALTDPLSPLAAHKSYLTVLSGFQAQTDGAHVGGSAAATTGTEPDELGRPQGPSIDQIVAQQIGQETPFRSLQVGLTKATPAGSQPCLHAVSHEGSSAPLYPEYDPHRLVARLFGLAAAPAAARLRRRSVLDAIKGDFDSLKRSVGRADAQRLDAHASGIRDLERRLAEVKVCDVVEAPGPQVQADSREEAPAALHDAMSRLIAIALQCDLTNVYSYVFSLPAAHVYYRHLGPEFDRSYHEDIVHLVDGIPNGYGLVDQGVKYVTESLAVSLDHLASVPTPTGNLLDDIALLVTSDVSYGWTHEMHDYPALVAGKACGAIAGDRHIAATGQQRNFSDVLLTLTQTMGVRGESFGKGETRSTRTVPELLA